MVRSKKHTFLAEKRQKALRIYGTLHAGNDLKKVRKTAWLCEKKRADQFRLSFMVDANGIEAALRTVPGCIVRSVGIGSVNVTLCQQARFAKKAVGFADGFSQQFSAN